MGNNECAIANSDQAHDSENWIQKKKKKIGLERNWMEGLLPEFFH